ncbi:MAG: SRPBCC family protein [Ilumatobacteraceae bacterium]|nr:SRPBCC family protein [Ilumatobacteraceae bacterium]
MSTRHLEKSRTFPVSVETAYRPVLLAPLPQIFGRRYWAIAPIVEVTGQEGEWGTVVGQTRTIKMSDGGNMLETLTVIDQPNQFGYAISNVKGMLKLLVAAASGTWAFEPDGEGTRITWSWEVTPTKVIGRAAMPLFARLWSGSAGQAMEEIDKILSVDQT